MADQKSKAPAAAAKPWDRERRVYQFRCAGCGRPKALTHRRSKARAGLCRKCRAAAKVNPDQIPLL